MSEALMMGRPGQAVLHPEFSVNVILFFVMQRYISCHRSSVNSEKFILQNRFDLKVLLKFMDFT